MHVSQHRFLSPNLLFDLEQIRVFRVIALYCSVALYKTCKFLPLEFPHVKFLGIHFFFANQAQFVTIFINFLEHRYVPVELVLLQTFDLILIEHLPISCLSIEHLPSHILFFSFYFVSSCTFSIIENSLSIYLALWDLNVLISSVFLPGVVVLYHDLGQLALCLLHHKLLNQGLITKFGLRPATRAALLSLTCKGRLPFAFLFPKKGGAFNCSVIKYVYCCRILRLRVNLRRLCPIYG